MIEIIKSDLQSFYSYPNIKFVDRKVGVIYFFKAILDIDFRSIFIYRLACLFKNMG